MARLDAPPANLALGSAWFDAVDLSTRTWMAAMTSLARMVGFLGTVAAAQTPKRKKS